MEVSPSPKAGSSLLPAICEIGLLAEAVLQRARTGRVTAVFESSFYVAFGGEWICIGLSHIGSGPLHVLCESKPDSWPQLGSSVGVAGPVLYLDNMSFAVFDRASIWKPERAPGWTAISLQRGLGAASELWREEECGEGLAAAGCIKLPMTLTPLVSAAAPGIAALDRIITNALDGRSSSFEEREDLSKLIGLGPGLTPSGDDLLGGALLALALLDRIGARDRLWQASCGYLDRTNDISRLHLQTAVRGYGAAALHDAIHATIGGDVNHIPRALAAVSAIGHSSGRDSFAGALIALRAVERDVARDKTRVSAPIET